MRRSAALVCLVSILLTAFLRPVSAGERLALLIGNKKYNAKVGPLTNPHNDIKLVATALEKLGFKTTKITDAKFDTLQKAVRTHAAKVRAAGPDTISFFYYSGHGAADANTKLNYLIPVDVPDANDTSLWSNSVELKADIIDKFGEQAPGALHLVVFDACRNELKLKNKDMKAIEVDGQGFVAVQRSRFLIAYSTEAKRSASDVGVGSGPYARILAEELVSPGVEAATMFRNVQLRIMQSIGQYPYASVDGIPALYLAGKGGSPPRVASPQADIAAFERERASERQSMRTTLQQIGSAGYPSGGAFRPEKKWTKRNLNVCFMDGSRDHRAYVASVARQWSLYGEIDFDFGPWDDPRSCTAGSERDVAITFNRSGNWASLGTDAVILTKSGEPTMSLQSVGSVAENELRSSKLNRDILHEFGHVLGFDHNWKAPVTGTSCEKEFNWDRIYKELGNQNWSKRTVDDNFRRSPSQNIIGAFDKNSIMNYEFPASFFLKGRNSPCYLTPLYELSLRDKLAMFTIYK